MSEAVLYVLVLTAWLSTSSASILVLLSGTSALVCAFWRLLIATVLTSAYSLAAGGSRSFLPRDPESVVLSLLSGAFLAAHFLTWMESLFYIPVSLSTTIVVLYPLVAMLYEATLKLSRPRLPELIGILVAFCGTLIAVQPYLAGRALYGSVLAFCGALTGAAYFTIGRLLRKRGIGLASYTTACYGASTVFVLAYSVATGGPILPAEASSWVYLVLLAVVPMLGGHTVINYLVKYMKSYVATAIGFGEAPGSAILASLVLSQEVKPNVVVGMAVALAGALYAIRGSGEPRTPPRGSRSAQIPHCPGRYKGAPLDTVGTP